MKRIILTCLFSIILFSCSLDDGLDDYGNFKTEILPIDEITLPTSLNYEEKYTIPFKYTLPDGCHSYDQLYYASKDSTRTVAVYVLVDQSEGACDDVVVQEEDEFVLTVSQTEDYIFKIWKGTNDQDEDVFEEYIVPVLEPNQQP